MAERVAEPGPAGVAQGHARFVRISHWILAASLLTLACSGVVILMVHPRLYWGNAGNDLMPALLELPISRNHRHGGFDAPRPFFKDAAGPVSASRTYDIFNQNGWARSLHFLAAWCLVVPGAVYLLTGLLGGHFRSHRVSSGGTSPITCACGSRPRAAVRATACCRNAPTRSWSSWPRP
jgi:hypothetical protein